jgi:pimeloyl-ACP methyl ester carboxylesterase
MSFEFTAGHLREVIGEDPELLYRLKGFTGRLRVSVPPAAVDVVIRDGTVEAAVEASGEAVLTLTIPADVLAIASQPVPPPGYESATIAQSRGVRFSGDMATAVAPYAGVLSRLYELLRRAGGAGPAVELPAQDPLFADTDTAVGRYVYLTVEGVRYRVYYEQSGTGEQVLLLQHTAGADGRQWRNQLADPEFQRRFRVIAYDLPFHGRSMPPTSQRWWESAYRPTKDWMMAVVIALTDALELGQPVFMGCSVGGQLALDLAAHHGDRFAAVIAINGTLDNARADDPWVAAFNDLARDNRVSTELYAIGNFNATSPLAPEPYRRELYWLYRSNFPGIYAGDNDYFLTGHDLTVNGHLLDTSRTPVYLLAGEYDPVALDPDHGSPAVADRFPGIHFHVLKGLGHFAPTDDPLGLRAAILPILDDILGSGATER